MPRRRAYGKELGYPKIDWPDLTPIEAEFVQQYTLNPQAGATAAARATGMAPSTVGQRKWSLLRNPRVGAMIRRLRHESGIRPDWVIRRLAQEARLVDLADFEPYMNGEIKTLRELRATGVDTSRIEKIIKRKDGSRGVILRNPIPPLVALGKLLVGEKAAGPEEGAIPANAVTVETIRELRKLMDSAKDGPYYASAPRALLPVDSVQVLADHGEDGSTADDTGVGSE